MSAESILSEFESFVSNWKPTLITTSFIRESIRIADREEEEKSFFEHKSPETPPNPSPSQPPVEPPPPLTTLSVDDSSDLLSDRSTNDREELYFSEEASDHESNANRNDLTEIPSLSAGGGRNDLEIHPYREWDDGSASEDEHSQSERGKNGSVEFGLSLASEIGRMMSDDEADLDEEHVVVAPARLNGRFSRRRRNAVADVPPADQIRGVQSSSGLGSTPRTSLRRSRGRPISIRRRRQTYPNFFESPNTTTLSSSTTVTRIQTPPPHPRRSTPREHTRSRTRVLSDASMLTRIIHDERSIDSTPRSRRSETFLSRRDEDDDPDDVSVGSPHGGRPLFLDGGDVSVTVIPKSRRAMSLSRHGLIRLVTDALVEYDGGRRDEMTELDVDVVDMASHRRGRSYPQTRLLSPPREDTPDIPDIPPHNSSTPIPSELPTPTRVRHNPPVIAPNLNANTTPASIHRTTHHSNLNLLSTTSHSRLLDVSVRRHVATPPPPSLPMSSSPRYPATMTSYPGTRSMSPRPRRSARSQVFRSFIPVRVDVSERNDEEDENDGGDDRSTSNSFSGSGAFGIGGRPRSPPVLSLDHVDRVIDRIDHANALSVDDGLGNARTFTLGTHLTRYDDLATHFSRPVHRQIDISELPTHHYDEKLAEENHARASSHSSHSSSSSSQSRSRSNSSTIETNDPPDPQPTQGQGHEQSSLSDNSKICAICTEQFQTGDHIRTLPCFHMFHVHEIDQWFDTKRNCPVCRCSIDILNSLNANGTPIHGSTSNFGHSRSSARIHGAHLRSSTMILHEDSDLDELDPLELLSTGSFGGSDVASGFRVGMNEDEDDIDLDLLSTHSAPNPQHRSWNYHPLSSAHGVVRNRMQSDRHFSVVYEDMTDDDELEERDDSLTEQQRVRRGLRGRFVIEDEEDDDDDSFDDDDGMNSLQGSVGDELIIDSEVNLNDLFDRIPPPPRASRMHQRGNTPFVFPAQDDVTN